MASFPNDRDLAFIDLAGLALRLPDRIIEHANLIGAGLHDLDRARMVAGKTDLAKHFIGRAAAKRRTDKIFRHDAARGRGARAKREGFAFNRLGKIGRRFQAARHIGDHEALEACVFCALRDSAEFAQVRVVDGSLEWPGEIDLSYDTVYLRSVVVKQATAV